MSHVNLPPASLLTIKQLAEFCGLLHDLGKLTARFQRKLSGPLNEGDSLRDAISHEWISAWLVARMLEQANVSWDGFLAAWNAWEQTGIEQMRVQAHQWRPFSSLDGLAPSCLMVIATHHRLFSLDARPINGQRTCTRPDETTVAPAQNHVTSPLPLTQASTIWHRVAKWDSATEQAHWKKLLSRANELLTSLQAGPELPAAHWHKSSLVARAAMVLADQHVSARAFAKEPGAKLYQDVQAYANTSDLPRKGLNQPLTWHLAQVGQTAEQYVYGFAATDLPALGSHTRLQLHGDSAAAPARFAWQTSACDFVRQLRESEPGAHAFLIFNVASTGAGKTRANVRILESCRAKDDPLRITAGFNLKTLTLQTALAYRQELHLGPQECACIIGDPLARSLHLHEAQDDECAKAPEQFNSTGCDSKPFLDSLPAWLRAMAPDTSQASLIAAPVLVCTMDYLVAAGDPSEQAHHAHALLRMAHADLLIDEADSYDPEGLVAVLRVVQMAGMLGRNVLVSSATLSPVLAQQIQRAWQSGIAMHQAGCEAKLHIHEVITSNLGAEHGLQSQRRLNERFADWYPATLAAMYAAPPAIYRIAKILSIEKADPVPAQISETTFSASAMADACHIAHADNSWPAHIHGQSVQMSIGVVRMANVAPSQALAEQLTQHTWPEGTVAKVCAYHAQDVAMRRYLKEHALDTLLKRHGNPDVSQHPLLQESLADLPPQTRHVILLVLASPVEEVGRDHDFDWAIIEPSSMHSIIQLAGRVNRHRLKAVTQPNVFILGNNVRKLRGETVCFTRPGLQQTSKSAESNKPEPITHLPSHASALLQPAASEDTFALDARLIFSATQRCRFAEEDDRAIELLLKDVLPFFDENHAQWGCDWLYERYPLRTRERQEVWKAVPIFNGKITLHRHEATLRGRSWVEKMDTQEQRLPHEHLQWLCPSLHATDRWMKQKLSSIGGSSATQEQLLDAAHSLTVSPGTPQLH